MSAAAEGRQGRQQRWRLLRWWWACWRQAITRDLQFRTQTVLIALGTIIDVVVSLVPALVVAQAASTSSSGWSSGTALVVVGLFTISSAVLATVLGPNLLRLDDAVRTGELDLLLIRPVPALLAVTVRWVRPAEATRVLAGIALVIAGVVSDGTVLTIDGVAGCAALMALGTTAWALAWINVSFLSFWWVSAAPVQDIVSAVQASGQYPLAAFARAPRLLLSTVMPALLIGSVPAAVLLGGHAGGAILAALAVVVVGAGITAGHWQVVIRRYESASS